MLRQLVVKVCRPTSKSMVYSCQSLQPIRGFSTPVVPAVSEKTVPAPPDNSNTARVKKGLMQFFDDEKNWGEMKVRVGRSWRVDELRIRSNTDLHKLWYILLKEKNMLLTMEKECKRQCELFPNPERMDKVDESMANIETVVKERNRAYFQLETGLTGERSGMEEENFLGLPEYREFEEHAIPKEQNKDWLKKKSEEPKSSDAEKHWFYLKWRGKQKKWAKAERNMHVASVHILLEMFPDVDVEALKHKYPMANVDRIVEEKKKKIYTNRYSSDFTSHFMSTIAVTPPVKRQGDIDDW